MTPLLETMDGLRVVRGHLFKSLLLLSPALFLSLLSGPQPAPVRGCWLFLANMFLFLLFAYAANDDADRACDLAAGKARTIARLSRTAAVWILAAAALVNLAAGFLASGRGLYLALLCAGLFCGFAYSEEPFRIKERGLLGVLFPAAFGKLIPILLACALYRRIGWWAAALLSGEYVKNTIDILFHQVMDLDDDRAAGVRTFAVRQGAGRAQALLRRLSWLGAPLALATAAAYSLHIPEFRWVLAGILGGAVPAALAARRVFRPSNPMALTERLPFLYLYFGYSVFMLGPFWLALIAALRDRSYAPLLVFVAAVMALQTWFYVGYRYR
jgi:4-hydroxybenzoate polyprenyltransferase